MKSRLQKQMWRGTATIVAVTFSAWLCGCMPTNNRMKEIADQGKAFVLSDVEGNKYVATHIQGDNWKLVPAQQ